MMFRMIVLTSGAAATAAFGFEGVRNFRQVSGGLPIYRSANFDEATQADVETLLDGVEGRQIGAIVELRNDEELKSRSKPAKFLYETLGARAVHRPIIKDIDAFWNAVEKDVSVGALAGARFSTIWDGGAVDRALARHLEQQRLPGLYKGIVASAPDVFGLVFDDVLATLDRGEAVVFNCQKGKDRTGLCSAFIEHTLDVDFDEILDNYAKSASLLGEKDDYSPDSSSNPDAAVDWSLFRGSPRDAMAQTFAWIQEEYGSVDNYLTKVVGFDQQHLRRLSSSPRSPAPI